MTTLAAVLGLLLSDPLFTRMEGDWIGEGERTFPISGRTRILKSKVHSRVEDDRLISRNAVEEIPVGPDEPQAYIRLYWIRATAPGETYELGSGAGDAAVSTSKGTFDGRNFFTEQDLGGGYVIRSRSVFADDGFVELEELGYHDATPILVTKLKFQKAGSL